MLFFERCLQWIAPGGKIGIEKRIAGGGVDVSKANGKMELLMLQRTVRLLFYQALAEQKLVDLRTRLLATAKESATTAAQLVNVGILDQPDLLSAQVESQKAFLAASMAQTGVARTWRQLAAITGLPSTPTPILEGSLETLPSFDAESVARRIQLDNPQIAEALAEITRSEGMLAREKASRIPDLRVRSGIRYNRELLELNNRPVGKETFLDVGVEVPLFNRNQGNILAAAAERDRARLGVSRLKIDLESRIASAVKEHQDARLTVQLVRDDMLPKAKQALIEIRDAKTRAFAEGRGYSDLFQDVASLNSYLQTNEATVALFKRIEQSDPALAQGCYFYAESALVERGEYELCLKAIGDPQQRFEVYRLGWEMQKQSQRSLPARNLRLPPGAPSLPDMTQLADNNFIKQARTLIEILVGVGRKAEAEKIRDQAVAVLDVPELQSTVGDAEKKLPVKPK